MATFDPIRKFVSVAVADIVEALNTLINEINERLAAFVSGGANLTFPTRAAIQNAGLPIGTVAALTEQGRLGSFILTAGDFTAQIAGDPLQGIYFADNTIPVATAAWVRIWSDPSKAYVTPQMFGAVANGNKFSGLGTDDSPAIQAAFDFAATYPECVVSFVPGSVHAMTTSVTMSLAKNVIVIARGVIFTSATADIVFFSRMPADQTQAGTAVPFYVKWYGGEFWGAVAPPGGQIALQIGATYQSVIEDCQSFSLDTFIDIQFGLQTYIRSCMSTNSRTYGFRLRNGQWTGAGLSNAQSNSSVIDSCRVFARAGSTASYKIEGTSGCILRDIIAEGGNPANNVYYESLGSSTAKGFCIDGMHSENVPTNAVILAAMASSDLIVDRLFAQGTVAAIDNTGSTGSSGVYFRSSPFLASTTFFKNATATNSIWMFGDIATDPTDPTRWYSATGYTQPSLLTSLLWVGSGRGLSGLIPGLNFSGLMQIRGGMLFPTNAIIGASSTSTSRPASLHLLTSWTVAGGAACTGFLSASVTLDFPSIASGTTAELTISVPGAVVGDPTTVTPNGAIEAGLIWCGFVSAANTITVRLLNSTAAPVDPAIRFWRALVIKAV